jgi:hypothetical protein
MKIKSDSSNKKSQSEIVGFVLIVVIVSVLGLIFLSLSISKNNKKATSAEFSDFLQASMYYTTDCAVGFIPQYKNLQELTKACYTNEICLNKNNSCDVLSSTYTKLIKQSFNINPDRPNKAYRLNIYYTAKNSTSSTPIINISEGIFKDCSSAFGVNNPIYISSGNSYGNINIDLEICKQAE